MKRKFIYIFLFLFLICMFSCADDKKEVFSPIDEYIYMNIDRDVIGQERINLPMYNSEFNCEIKWKSLDSDYVLDNGIIIKKSNEIKVISFLYSYSLDAKVFENEIDINLYPSSIEEVSMLFENQFKLPIDKSYNDIKTVFFDCYYVSWYSSKPEIFSNEGELLYDKKSDIDFDIIYTVTILDKKKEFVLDCFTNPLSDIERIERTYNELFQVGGLLHDVCISSDLTFINSVNKYGVYIDLLSNENDVIDNDGNVVRSVFRQYVDTTLILSYKNIKKEYDLNFIVKEIEVEGLNDEDIIEMFLNSIALSEYSGIKFGYYDDIKTQSGENWIINKSFGFIRFYKNEYPKQIESLMDINDHNLPGNKLKSLEFIVLHDTGSTGSAKNHRDALLNENSKVSFHYAVDTREIYHIVSDDLYAYHAGCGKREFKLIDTNIKATNSKPKLEINKYGYYCFNGIVSNIKAPLNNGKILKTKDIVDAGIYIEIGDNGNYFINDSYYNKTYKKISNTGGGINGIGIEMCVVPNEDYIITVKNTSKLVAKLLNDYDLDIDRILQHNNFSGKDCPISIRRIDWFDEFKELVSMELFALKYLNNYDFVWESKSNLMNNDGLISLDVKNGDKLKYSCDVYKDNKIIYSNDFESIIKI